MYRSSLPQQNSRSLTSLSAVVINKTNNTINASKNNESLTNNTTALNNTTAVNNTTVVNNTTNLNMGTILNNIINFTNISRLNNTMVVNNTTDLNNNTGNTTDISNTTNITNTTNAINLDGNVYGVNDVSPSQEPMPGNVTFSRSGTYMDEIYDIDLSNFPQEPQKPHPKWWQFWLWIDYGCKYIGWSFDVLGWGCNHMDSLNKLTSICKHVQLDSKS